MTIYRVRGAQTLEGTYTVSGAKNAGPKLPILGLYSNKPSTFFNIPKISDSEKTALALRALGRETSVGADGSFTIGGAETDDSEQTKLEIPQEAMRARQSVLFLGAALANFGRVRMPYPKGDAIGRRPLNRHLDGIKALGGVVKEPEEGILEVSFNGRPESADYTFDKPTHCGTENLILASVFNKGKVILRNVALEPEVDNMINCLNSMGANISRTESRVIEIIGVEPSLEPPSPDAATSIPDRLEGATAIALSVITGGNTEVQNVEEENLRLFVDKLSESGVRVIFEGNRARVMDIPEQLLPIKVETGPYPGFATDWQPLITLLLAVKSQGVSEIHERVFEQRWRFLKELKKMGVEYELFHPEGYESDDYNFNNSEYSENEPYGARVFGPTELKGAEVDSNDVRAGVDMILAGLVASGNTEVNDPQDHIRRAYEDFVPKLTKLGADIKIL